MAIGEQLPPHFPELRGTPLVVFQLCSFRYHLTMTCFSKPIPQSPRGLDEFLINVATVMHRHAQVLHVTRSFCKRSGFKQSYEDQRAQMSFHQDILMASGCTNRMATVISSYFFRNHGPRTPADKYIIQALEDCYSNVLNLFPTRHDLMKMKRTSLRLKSS